MTPVAVTCVGLVSPAGYSAASTAAALRSGIAAFAELPYADPTGTPLVGATVADLDTNLRGTARLVALLDCLLEELDPPVSSQLPWREMPLVLCTREAGRPGPRLQGLIAERRFPEGTRFGGGRAVHLDQGSASIGQALALARRHVLAGPEHSCLILAADSYIDARTLLWLDKTERLKTSERTDGLLPGEAACLLVVTRQPIAPASIMLEGVGSAEEPAHVLNEEPFRADGMTRALSTALQEARRALHEVDVRLSDLAGDSYAFEEMTLVQARLMRQVRESQPLWHPADCIGDTGAAAGLIQLAWLGEAFARGYAPGKVAAVHATSAFGARAAAIVSAPGGASA